MKQNKKKHLWMGIWFLLAFLLWTTLLVLSVMPTLVFQVNRRCERKTVKRTVSIFVVLFSAFMVIGRSVSGVHWATDIVGSVLLSFGLFKLYQSGVTAIDLRNKNGVQ